jgi:tripartite-type tricarboxylate transporter receptor subunit TctC
MVTLINVAETAPYLPGNRLLMVTTPQRDEQVPQLPAARESGLPDMEVVNCSGLVIASATPAAAVARLNQEVVRALNLGDVRDLLEAQAVNARTPTAEEFNELLRSGAARYLQVARAANVKVE